MKIGRASALMLRIGFVVFLASSASAQTASPAAFVRSEDEKSLTDLQLLGKRIFEDTNLSEPRGMSCMSCHAPKHAFQERRAEVRPSARCGS